MEDFSALITQLHWFAVAAFVVLLLSVLWRARRGVGSSRRGVTLFRVARMIALAIAGIAVIFGFTVLLPLAPIAQPIVRTLVFLLLATWIVAESYLLFRKTSTAVKKTERTVITGWIYTAILFAGGAFLLRNVPDVLGWPDSDIVLSAPFEGRWVATHAGQSIATNHHVRVPEQDYSADLALLGPDNRVRRRQSDTQEDAYTFGAPIYAPVDGVVSAAVDGFEDGKIPSRFEDVAGNHVFIEVAPDRHVLLAHLKEGSVVVSPGERVRVGDAIGAAGNSGNSDFPHLHIHVQDRPRIERGAAAFPWVLGGVERQRMLIRLTPERTHVLRNDILHAKPDVAVVDDSTGG